MALLDGIIGCWSPSLGATGYRLLDRSSNANHMTLTNMAVTAWEASSHNGRSFTALTLDGTNDDIRLARTFSLNLPASVSLWCKYTSSGVIILFEPQNTSNYAQILSASGQIRVGCVNSASAETIGPAINDGKWHHVVGVWAANDLRQLYVDGTLRGTSTFSLSTLFQVAFFGSRSNSSLFFPGSFGEIAVYRRQVTAPEVMDLYRSGNGWIGRELTGMNRRRRYGKSPVNRRRRFLLGAAS